jgi:hypothetical protein
MIMTSPLLRSIAERLWGLVITPYRPQPECRAFLARAQTQEQPAARVTVAVLSGAESRRAFGVDLARRGIQPVFVRIEHRGGPTTAAVRLQLVNLDPRYFTPLEAAGVNHFSILRRLSAFGALGWLFLPMVLLAPLKLFTAATANRRMDTVFRSQGFRLRPIAPGETAEGFVFTTLDLGSKPVHVRLGEVKPIRGAMARSASDPAMPSAAGDYLFTVPVPGIDADYHERDLEAMRRATPAESCTIDQLVARLEAMPAATTNASGGRTGDPVNLAVVGSLDILLSAFAGRWDESETISLLTCWKTVRAFLLGSNYRYSPVSGLWLFGRVQDIALQRTRHSINERLHLRLWLTGLDFEGQPVWVGQVSRDIGVRFTTRAWNLTTHRIDPDVDEARDYVIEDLLEADRVTAAGYVGGVGACGTDAPRRNLTGDPYFTDGARAVIVLATTRHGSPTPAGDIPSSQH